jgi:glycosyltransferase involved in cell wall biosynthesis
VKVAHVNTLSYGGAAVVARRIHLALLDLQMDSYLVTKYGVKGHLRQHRYVKDERVRIFLRKKLMHPSIFPLAKFIRSLRPHPNLAKRPTGFEIFSPLYQGPLMPEGLLEDIDIVHLHWINNFVDDQRFFKTYESKKFVWTLHDMNPITGGCHHSDGCMKFESKCVQCPQLDNTIDPDYSFKIQGAKIDGLKYLKDDQLIIASPSQWLKELSEKSAITGRFQHVLVPNPSFNEVDFDISKEALRYKLGLPLNKKLVLFASDNLRNPRKGIDLLFDAIRLSPRKDELILVGIGHKTKGVDGIDMISTGSISDHRKMAAYFYSADIFVTPTLAENSPLVIIESLSCGTPVVASRVGGIPDIVNESNGLLFPKGDKSAFAKAIEKALFESRFDPESIKKGASRFNPVQVTKQYIDIYRDLLKAT